MQQFDELPRRW